MNASAFTLTSLFAALSVTATCPNTFAQRCMAFEPEKLVPNATRTALEFVKSGTTLQFPDNVKSCGRPQQKVTADLCRVALHIPTSNRSEITFELWLPEKWEGNRFIATGNGGIDGCVKYEDLAYISHHGFAAVGTNNGHNGSTGEPFYHNPDVLEDYARRSLHTGTTVGKLLTEHFYAKKPEYSYFIGCSLGGRMGVHAAEMFPDDFDGIVAGAPAVDFNRLQGERAMFYPITGKKGSKDFITVDQWGNLIHNEVMRQCDELDGVKDGIIEVVERCFFDPEPLRCSEVKERAECLNDAQIKQLEKIYAPYTYPNGTLIYARMNPGNEKFATQRLLAGEPFQFSEDWFRYVVLNDPSWDALTYNIDDVTKAEELNPFNIRTYPQTLPDFKARGGKMISYHGGQDNQITSLNTERFVTRMMDADTHLADYYRFFRIAGMNHCNSGPGAWVFGQGGNLAGEGIAFDAETNVLAAIVAWVEEKKAPETITGTKFVNDTVSLGVDFQRSHCPFPKVQTFQGGDYKKTTSWKCI